MNTKIAKYTFLVLLLIFALIVLFHLIGVMVLGFFILFGSIIHFFPAGKIKSCSNCMLLAILLAVACYNFNYSGSPDIDSFGQHMQETIKEADKVAALKISKGIDHSVKKVYEKDNELSPNDIIKQLNSEQEFYEKITEPVKNRNTAQKEYLEAATMNDFSYVKAFKNLIGSIGEMNVDLEKTQKWVTSSKIFIVQVILFFLGIILIIVSKERRGLGIFLVLIAVALLLWPSNLNASKGFFNYQGNESAVYRPVSPGKEIIKKVYLSEDKWSKEINLSGHKCEYKYPFSGRLYVKYRDGSEEYFNEGDWISFKNPYVKLKGEESGAYIKITFMR